MGNVFLFYHSTEFLPYFLTLVYFRVSFTPLKRRGGGISESRDPPSVKSITTRQTVKQNHERADRRK